MGIVSNATKAIGRWFSNIGTVLPPADYDFASGGQFTHVLSIAINEDNPTRIRLTNPYLQNSWVFSATRVMAENFAQVDFNILLGEKIIESTSTRYGWVPRLFEYVSPTSNAYLLKESIIIGLTMAGECFWELIRGINNQPVEINIPNPHSMEEVISGGQLIGWKEHTGKGIRPIPKEDIILFKTYNPYNKYRGLSPLTAASLGMNIDYAAGAYNYYFFDNDATPTGILSTEQVLRDTEAEAIRDKWNKTHRGAKRKGKIAVLGKGAKYQNIAIAQKDIEYIAQKKWSREEVFAVLNVPPALCQVLEYASIKSNIKEQRRQLYENNLIPKMHMVEAVLKTDFFTREKVKELTGVFDISNIDALKGQLNERLDAAKKLQELGYTADEINEKLELGFEEEQEWRKHWWIPLNLYPADMPAPAPDKNKEKGIVTKTPRRRVNYEHVWNDIHRAIDPYETKYKKALAEYFYEMRSEILEKIYNIKGYKSAEADTAVYEILRSISPDFEKYQDKLIGISKPPFEAVYKEGIDSVADFITTNFSMANSRAINTINNKLIKVVDINKTIKKQLVNDIRPIIETAIKEGHSYQSVAGELADGVKNIFNNARRRTATVARTEINGVLSQSRYDTMGESGVEKHQWYSTRYIRESHIANHLKIRRIGEPFPSGIAYPHDEAGPAEEVINCSCITVPVEE